MNLAERMHVVQALAPVDINGGKNSDVWSMKNYRHATIIVLLGVTGGASTITVEEADDFVPTTTTAIPFNVYKEETAGGDTLGARVATALAGFATSLNDGVFYVIEIDSAELSSGKPNLRVVLSDPAVATFGAVVVILSDARYESDQSESAIA